MTKITIPTEQRDHWRREIEVDDAALKAVAIAIGVIRVEEYSTGDGWRWRLQDPGNNEIIGAATQGFHDRNESRQNFLRNYHLVGGTRAIYWVEVEA